MKSITLPVVREATHLDAMRELVAIQKQGCRFISLTYTSKGTGEIARHTLAVGVNLLRAYRRDLIFVVNYQPTSELEEIARNEIEQSLRESLKVGLGNNSRYNNKGLYKHVFNGIKINAKTGQIYCYGFSLRKEVLQPGVYKTVNSKPLTICKDKIRAHLKHTRHRDFILDNIHRVALNGNVLELS